MASLKSLKRARIKVLHGYKPLPSVICNYRAPLITRDSQQQLKQSISKHYLEVLEYKCMNCQNSKSLRMLQLTASKEISSSRNLAEVLKKKKKGKILVLDCKEGE